jgi:hypothetical protein
MADQSIADTISGVIRRFRDNGDGTFSEQVVVGAPPTFFWQYAAASGGIVNTSDVVAQAAGGAGIRHYIKSLQVKNTHATVATEFVIKDGSTVKWRMNLPALMVTAEAIEFDPPIRCTANTALNIANITTGAAVYANLQGYDAP